MIGLTLLLSTWAGERDDLLDTARLQSTSGQPSQALDTLAPLLMSGDGEALVLAGTIHLDAGQLLLARQRLERALRTGTLSDPGSAHLSMARSFVQTGDAESARQHAAAAVAAAGDDDGRLDESLAVLIEISSTSMGPGEAMGLLAGVLPEESLPQVWEALADGYLSRDMASAAGPPLEAAIATAPDSPRAPYWQAQLADAAFSRGRISDEVLALEALARGYTAGSPWAEAQPDTSAATAQADVEEMIEARIRASLLRLHQDTRLMPAGTQASHSIEQLSRLVLVWLVRYPDHEAAPQVHGLYGELLIRTGRFEEAHIQHMAAWDLSSAAEHLFAAAFAAERSFTLSAPPASIDTEHRLNKPARQLLSCVALYHDHFPDTEADHTLQLKAAAVLVRLGHIRDARRHLMGVIEAGPDTALAERAARQVLDSYILVSDWRGVRAAAESFEDSPGLSSPAFRARLDEILDQTASLR